LGITPRRSIRAATADYPAQHRVVHETTGTVYVPACSASSVIARRHGLYESIGVLGCTSASGLRSHQCFYFSSCSAPREIAMRLCPGAVRRATARNWEPRVYSRLQRSLRLTLIYSSRSDGTDGPAGRHLMPGMAASATVASVCIASSSRYRTCLEHAVRETVPYCPM
jgi:hypothetical protein